MAGARAAVDGGGRKFRRMGAFEVVLFVDLWAADGGLLAKEEIHHEKVLRLRVPAPRANVGGDSRRKVGVVKRREGGVYLHLYLYI